MKAIEIQALNYVFPDGTIALRGVTLAVNEGERVAVLGANGAGKTTLLLHLNGILTGVNGAVRILGQVVSKASLKEVRRQVGIVFQNPDDQLFCPTVYDDVAFGPQNLGLAPAEVAQRVRESLRMVGMEGAEKRSAFHMSCGEKKRVAIATVLAMDSRILAFDEPTSNLDPRARRELAELLLRFGHTQLIATHDLEFARRLCERAVVLSHGSVVADGDTQAILGDSDLLLAHGLA
jgi:cobalt transport protein ATP-binding subunit